MYIHVFVFIGMCVCLLRAAVFVSVVAHDMGRGGLPDVRHCNTLQHTATHCNTLQHTATHCNTLQHTATLCTPDHVVRIGMYICIYLYLDISTYIYPYLHVYVNHGVDWDIWLFCLCMWLFVCLCFGVSARGLCLHER